MGDGIKVAVIGGGSSYTPELVEGLLDRADSLPVAELWLVDVVEGERKQNTVADLARRMIARRGGSMRVETTLDRRRALAGAHFVASQMRVGGLPARYLDETVPLQYGVIGQETVGAGGFANALRTIPVALEIAYDMEQLCPNAFLFNFTNPSGLVTEAIATHSRIRVVGLCNLPIITRYELAEHFRVPVSDLDLDFFGLNHLVWVRSVRVRGVEMMDHLLEQLRDASESGRIGDLPASADYVAQSRLLPCHYHRYYHNPLGMLESIQKAPCARATEVMQIEEDLFRVYADPATDAKPEQLARRGGAHYSEAAVSLMDAVWNNRREVHVVDTVNRGSIPDLPYSCVVEQNAVIDAAGAHPIAVGEVPIVARGLMQQVKAYEQLTIAAAVTGSYDLAWQALASNPLVPGVDVARRVLDALLDAHRAYLPQFAAARPLGVK